MTVVVPAPNWHPPTIAHYHGDVSRWSSSMVRKFRSSPGLAWMTYVARSLPVERPGEALVVGSAVHRIMETGGEPTGIHVAECEARSAKVYHDAVAAFEPAGRLVLTRREWDLSRRVADALLEPRTTSAALGRAMLTAGDAGHSEWCYRWSDETGVSCKTLNDRVTLVRSELAVGELKTCRNPDPAVFHRDIGKLGYGVQAAFEVRGVRHAFAARHGIPLADVPPVAFYWIAVGKSAPWSVYYCRAPTHVLEDGEVLVEHALRRIAGCLHDSTGASWAHAWERLDDGQIPVAEAPAFSR